MGKRWTAVLGTKRTFSAADIGIHAAHDPAAVGVGEAHGIDGDAADQDAACADGGDRVRCRLRACGGSEEGREAEAEKEFHAWAVPCVMAGRG
jgi:hypothetical protein